MFPCWRLWRPGIPGCTAGSAYTAVRVGAACAHTQQVGSAGHSPSALAAGLTPKPLLWPQLVSTVDLCDAAIPDGSCEGCWPSTPPFSVDEGGVCLLPLTLAAHLRGQKVSPERGPTQGCTEKAALSQVRLPFAWLKVRLAQACLSHIPKSWMSIYSIEGPEYKTPSPRCVQSSTLLLPKGARLHTPGGLIAGSRVL